MPKGKQAAQRSAGNSAKKRQRVDSNDNRGRRQTYAILTLAVAILLGAVLVIPGSNVWKLGSGALKGLFGPCAFLLPVFLIYISYLLAFDARKTPAKFWAAQGALLLILLCSAVQIFTVGKFPGFQSLYESGGKLSSGGIFGAPGALMVHLFGKTGAAITDLLMIAVCFLLLTGITLARIAQALKNGVGREKKNTREKPGVVIGAQGKAEKPRYNIDVNLGPSDRKKDEKDVPEPFRKRIEPIRKDTAELDALVGKIASLKEDTPSAPPLSTQPAEPAAASHPEPAVPDAQQQIYSYPPETLLRPGDPPANQDVAEELKQNAAHLVETLSSFGVETRITDISRGPAVTRYELQPSAGVKISRITSLSDDIALNLATAGVRIEAPIPNKAAVGIEVPNKKISIVHIREILESSEFHEAKSKLTVALGRDIAGKVALANIAAMPHLLIAGATGSGKSVCINSIIISLLYKAAPEEVKFLLVDPKIVELGVYNGIPHLLVPVVTEPRRAAGALGWAVNEMQNRYKLFADSGVRDLKGYNALARRTDGLATMPQVVIVIDELADLIMAAPGEVEEAICRLAQKARAAGMHLVIATQRPSVDVITGLIKANIPSRIAFAVSSQVDSRTILDSGGAEKLLGRGDMLFWPVGAAKPTRLQGCFVSDEEVEAVIDFVKRGASAEYDESVMDEIEKQSVDEKTGAAEPDSEEDPMFQKAVECVIDAGMASTSLLQRRLKLGYARAARIVDEMEARGIVGPFEGSKPRQVLISRQQWIEMAMNRAE